MGFAFIRTLSGLHPASILCRLMDVSRSGHCAFIGLQRPDRRHPGAPGKDLRRAPGMGRAAPWPRDALRQEAGQGA